MNLLEKIDFEENKLLAIYLGGKVPGFNIEAHDVVFVVAKHHSEVVEKVRELWNGEPKSLHIDSWFPLENIDNHDIYLETSKPENQERSLYFLNLGCYLKDQFGEVHFIKFVTATSKSEAKKKASELIKDEVELLHTDDLIDLDECIKLENIDGYFISLIQGNKKKNPPSVNGWQRLPRN